MFIERPGHISNTHLKYALDILECIHYLNMCREIFGLQ